MKHIAIAALILNLGVAYVHAQQRPVSLNFSGTSEATTLNLQPGANTSEENFTGDGSLGPFTYREMVGLSGKPALSSTCTGLTRLSFPFVSGAGIFRFEDGSLLTVKLTEGANCIDFSVPEGHVAISYQITGGTGDFQNASGTITVTATAKPILFNVANVPVFFSVTGDFAGTVAF